MILQIGEVIDITKAFKPNQKDEEGRPLPLGAIKVRPSGNIRHLGPVLDLWCRPSIFQKRIPLKHEQVLIYYGTTHSEHDGIVKEFNAYYIAPMNATIDVVIHQLPMDFHRSKDNRGFEDTDRTPGITFPWPVRVVEQLQPYDSDDILESRYGGTIRLGRTVIGGGGSYQNKPTWDGASNGDPIIIIRTKTPPPPTKTDIGGPESYTIENLAKDDSSVYVTSNQKLPQLIPAFPKNVDVSKTPIYSKSQVLLDATRIVLNARKDKVILTAKERGIFAAKKILIETQRYKVDWDELMDFLKEWLTQCANLAQGKAQYSTPAGPTATATNVSQYVKLLNVDFKKFET